MTRRIVLIQTATKTHHWIFSGFCCMRLGPVLSRPVPLSGSKTARNDAVDNMRLSCQPDYIVLTVRITALHRDFVLAALAAV
jgi:hypothetical protein